MSRDDFRMTYATIIVAVVALAVGAASAVAAALPDSCAAADRAKAAYLKRLGRDPITIQDRLLGDSADLAKTAVAREIALEAQLQSAGRMCIGDLVADQRYRDAANQALRYGLAKDAESLIRRADALDADPKRSAPTPP